MFHPKPTNPGHIDKAGQRKKGLLPAYAAFISVPTASAVSSDEEQRDEIIELLLADDLQLQTLYKKWQGLKAQKARFKLVELTQPGMQEQVNTLELEIQTAKLEYCSARQTAIAALFDYDLAYERQSEYYQHAGLDDESIARSMRSFPNPTAFAIQANKRLVLAYLKTISHPQAANVAMLLTDGVVIDPSWSNLSLFIQQPLPKQCFELSMSISGGLAQRMNELSDKKYNPWLKFALKSGKLLIGAIQAHPLVRIGGIIVFEAADSWSADLDAARLTALEQRLDQALKVQRQLIPRIAGGNAEDLRAMYEALNAPLMAMFQDPTTPYKIQRLLEAKINNNDAERNRQLEMIQVSAKRLVI